LKVFRQYLRSTCGQRRASAKDEPFSCSIRRPPHPLFVSHSLIVQSRDADTTLSLFGSGMKATDDTLCSCPWRCRCPTHCQRKFIRMKEPHARHWTHTLRVFTQRHWVRSEKSHSLMVKSAEQLAEQMQQSSDRACVSCAATTSTP